MKMRITPGSSGKVCTTVTEQDTASAVGSGSLRVLATPTMVALMERAACEALAASLDAGQTSVGISIAVEHTAASPVGSSVAAEATITSVSGRKVEFAVSASDNSGPVGSGIHTRIIVDSERFMKKAAAAKSE